MIARSLALGLLLGATLWLPLAGASKQVQPSPSPVVKPSPSPVTKTSPAPAPAAETGPFSGPWVTPALTALGAALVGLALSAWYLSNRAEATPNAEQLADIRRFVEDDFARYVARGLVGSGHADLGPEPANPAASLARDEGWRKVFLHQVDLDPELNRFRRQRALEVYEATIDAAVRRHLAELRAASTAVGPEAAQ